MSSIRVTVFASLAALMPGIVWAHGANPIHISLQGGRLVTDKYVYSDPSASNNFTSANTEQVTTVPGLSVDGGGAGQIQASDTIGFNVASPLWFSDGTSAQLAGPELLTIYTNLDPNPIFVDVEGDSPVHQEGGPLLSTGIALNAHRHYLAYDFIPSNSLVGAYGVFLEFTSPQYETSRRAFVAFNRGLDEATFQNAIIEMRSLPLGDMNDDGVLNNFDIQPFEVALTNSADYLTQFPSMDIYARRGDIDGNGAFNNFDIQPFEQLLTSGSHPALAAVPEPSALALMVLAAAAFGRFARKRAREIN